MKQAWTEPATETEHRYDPGTLRADYLRAGAGSLFSGGAVVLAGAAGWGAWLFGGACLLFLAFGGRTALRHAQRFRLSEEALSLHGPAIERHLRWEDLSAIKLRFYSTRRDRHDGWMQMTLRAGNTRLSFDSTLSDFDAIARRAAAQADANALALNRSTVANFQALGIDLPDAGRNRPG